MTEQTAPAPWDNDDQQPNWDGSPKAVSFPELPDNPHEAPLSVNFKPGGTPQLTVRARTVAEHMELLNQVKSSGLLALINSVSADFGGQGAAPQAPAQPNWNPQTPPPNQPFPGQPAWQQAGAPQAPQQQWGGQPQGGFNGGAQQGNRQGPKPRPEWPVVYKINVPYPAKEQFKSFREQNKDALKGKVSWAGGGDYWIHGDVVAGFGQYNPVAA